MRVVMLTVYTNMASKPITRRLKGYSSQDVWQSRYSAINSFPFHRNIQNEPEKAETIKARWKEVKHSGQEMYPILTPPNIPMSALSRRCLMICFLVNSMLIEKTPAVPIRLYMK